MCGWGDGETRKWVDWWLGGIKDGGKKKTKMDEKKGGCKEEWMRRWVDEKMDG